MFVQVTYDNDHDGTLIMNGTELYNEMNNSNHDITEILLLNTIAINLTLWI
jgi:hypothetical protein